MELFNALDQTIARASSGGNDQALTFLIWDMSKNGIPYLKFSIVGDPPRRNVLNVELDNPQEIDLAREMARDYLLGQGLEDVTPNSSWWNSWEECERFLADLYSPRFGNPLTLPPPTSGTTYDQASIRDAIRRHRRDFRDGRL